jgi:hypothetical protein
MKAPGFRLALPLLALALASASCSSIEARCDYDRTVDFKRYQTFAMAPPPSEAPEELPQYSELRGQAVNREIAAHLVAKGLREVGEPEADLIVSFKLAGETRTDVRSTGPRRSVGIYEDWYGVGWYDNDLYTVQYVVGTLLVDVFERAGQRLIWHGWSSVNLYSNEDAQKRGEVIRAVMDAFPPG